MPSSSTNAGVLTRMRTGKQKRPLEDTADCLASDDRLVTAKEVRCPKALSCVCLPWKPLLVASAERMCGFEENHPASGVCPASQRPVAVPELSSTPAQVKRRTAKRGCPLTLTLYVRWFSPSGKSKVNRLLLRPVISVDALQVCD